jgi:hypothetical protein
MLSPSASVTAAPSSHARRRFFLPAFICSSPFFEGAREADLVRGDGSTTTRGETRRGGGGGVVIRGLVVWEGFGWILDRPTNQVGLGSLLVIRPRRIMFMCWPTYYLSRTSLEHCHPLFFFYFGQDE